MYMPSPSIHDLLVAEGRRWPRHEGTTVPPPATRLQDSQLYLPGGTGHLHSDARAEGTRVKLVKLNFIFTFQRSKYKEWPPHKSCSRDECPRGTAPQLLWPQKCPVPFTWEPKELRGRQKRQQRKWREKVAWISPSAAQGLTSWEGIWEKPQIKSASYPRSGFCYYFIPHSETLPPISFN